MFKTTKSKVIFVVIFSVICIITTCLLVLYKNIDTEENENIIAGEEIIENEKIKDVAGIDLKGTYNQNDIELEKKKYSSEKVEIDYYLISGLKNKIVQEKINKEIEQYALNFYRQKITDLNEVEKVSVSLWIAGNYANTLSINLYCYASKLGNNDEYYLDNIGLNYNLADGEQIAIDKLFTSDAPIENILRQSAYYSFVENNVEMNLVGDLIVTSYNDIEDKVFEFITSYKNGKIDRFYYTPNYITIIYNEKEYINIKMEDYAEYIAIYNRYLTDESLFERNDIGLKNLYTLSERYSDVYYYTNYQKGSNYFIEINLMTDETTHIEFQKNLVEQKINDIENEVEKVKTLANKNSSKFYILNYYIYISTYEEWSTNQMLTLYEERGNSYEVTVHDFEESLEPIIIKYNRMEPAGDIPDYVYNFNEVLKIEPQDTMEYYNPQTGEKIVI